MLSIPLLGKRCPYSTIASSLIMRGFSKSPKLHDDDDAQEHTETFPTDTTEKDNKTADKRPNQAFVWCACLEGVTTERIPSIRQNASRSPKPAVQRSMLLGALPKAHHKCQF